MQSFLPSSRRLKATQTKNRLNQLLYQQSQRNPFLKVPPVTLGDQPIFLLIDADSMGEDTIIEWLSNILESALNFEGWICANRVLTQVESWLSQHGLAEQIRTYHAPMIHNAADHFLIDQSQMALGSDRHGAMIFCTLDRDLFVIADEWRLAQRPVFFAPLRLNESGQHIIQRARSQGMILITDSLNQLSTDL